MSALSSYVIQVTVERRFWRHALSRRAALQIAVVLGCMASVALAALLGRPESFLDSDFELARLLRGMALIKGAIALGSVTLLLWRFRLPVSTTLAAAYLAGAWMAAGASMLVWQLTLMPVAAALFHLGEFSLLIAAWRDSKPFTLRGSGAGAGAP